MVDYEKFKDIKFEDYLEQVHKELQELRERNKLLEDQNTDLKKEVEILEKLKYRP